MEREVGIGVDPMGVHEVVIDSSSTGATLVEQAGEAMEVRRGPWTVDEDQALVNYVNAHGEGRWNSLARSAGLKRSGKSCRLRWLNYLRPDVRRGNLTPQEQLLILELHSRWGNRWSKIAQHLPGRTDNEIKNFWRTRVQKHAKQLKCDVNSQQFRDAMRSLWMPRLLEKIHEAATASSMATFTTSTAPSDHPSAITAEPPMQQHATTRRVSLNPDHSTLAESPPDSSAGTSELTSSPRVSELTSSHDLARWGSSSDRVGELPTGGFAESDPLSPCGYLNPVGFPEFEQAGWGAAGGFPSHNLWAVDDIWF